MCRLLSAGEEPVSFCQAVLRFWLLKNLKKYKQNENGIIEEPCKRGELSPTTPTKIKAL